MIKKKKIPAVLDFAKALNIEVKDNQRLQHTRPLTKLNSETRFDIISTTPDFESEQKQPTEYNKASIEINSVNNSENTRDNKRSSRSREDLVLPRSGRTGSRCTRC